MGSIVRINGEELTFNIKSSKPLEELLSRLKAENYETIKDPIPLDSEFVDLIDKRIAARNNTIFAAELQKLINEPLQYDQSALFRHQSALRTYRPSGEFNLNGLDLSFNRKYTGKFGDSEEEPGSGASLKSSLMRSFSHKNSKESGQLIKSLKNNLSELA